MSRRDFLSGVIEGFYGPPWSDSQRVRLFDGLQGWGLNTYFYAPKDDLHHRALWRVPYGEGDADRLRGLAEEARKRGLRFVYGLAPGLDMAYADPTELRLLNARVEQLAALGIHDLALLFDDIPDRLSDRDRQVFGSFARAQAAVARALHGKMTDRQPKARFLFCPTPYCDRMQRAGLGGAQYLEEIGAELPASMDVLWTGPEIVSPSVDGASLAAFTRRVRRAPVLWDNLHANDYDPRRMYLGPYHGRPGALRRGLAGVLSNPNSEFEVNVPALATLAGWVQARNDVSYQPRKAYVKALRAWLPEFATVREPGLTLEDLVLFADCLYLPDADGDEAQALWADAAWCLGRPVEAWGGRDQAFRERARRLQRTAELLSELRSRELFRDLNRRAWELKEEMLLLLGAVAWKEANGSLQGFRSDFHRPPTYRGGFLRRVESLLEFTDDGGFRSGPGARSEREREEQEQEQEQVKGEEKGEEA
jgi:protein O-GlcNAcase/histone acetyltransferase